jgi:hypothetical protein
MNINNSPKTPDNTTPGTPQSNGSSVRSDRTAGSQAQVDVQGNAAPQSPGFFETPPQQNNQGNQGAPASPPRLVRRVATGNVFAAAQQNQAEQRSMSNLHSSMSNLHIGMPALSSNVNSQQNSRVSVLKQRQDSFRTPRFGGSQPNFAFQIQRNTPPAQKANNKQNSPVGPGPALPQDLGGARDQAPALRKRDQAVNNSNRLLNLIDQAQNLGISSNQPQFIHGFPQNLPPAITANMSQLEIQTRQNLFLSISQADPASANFSNMVNRLQASDEMFYMRAGVEPPVRPNQNP